MVLGLDLLLWRVIPAGKSRECSLRWQGLDQRLLEQVSGSLRPADNHGLLGLANIQDKAAVRCRHKLRFGLQVHFAWNDWLNFEGTWLAFIFELLNEPVDGVEFVQWIQVSSVHLALQLVYAYQFHQTEILARLLLSCLPPLANHALNCLSAVLVRLSQIVSNNLNPQRHLFLFKLIRLLLINYLRLGIEIVKVLKEFLLNVL